MKKNKLEIEYEFDFTLYALSCAEREYKLAWYLNEFLKVNFKKEEDIIFEFVNNSKMWVSNYIFEVEYGIWTLLNNKAVESINTTKPFLIPELKDFNFLLKLEGTFDEAVIEDVLRKIPIIMLHKRVNINELKTKENLLF